MITAPEVLERFENDFIRANGLSLEGSYRMLEWMRKEALYWGVFIRRDPLEGVETAIRIARILNACSN
jgi:hypothetical protein